MSPPVPELVLIYQFTQAVKMMKSDDGLLHQSRLVSSDDGENAEVRARCNV